MATSTFATSDSSNIRTLKDEGSILTHLKPHETMRAVRYYGKGDIRLEEVDEPRCKEGQVKIKPAFVGICGSDLHEYLGGPVLTPSGDEPHPLTGAKLPVALGHELSGTVTEVGDGVENVKSGDRVTVRPTIYDRTCAACRSGYHYCCEKIGFIGLCGYGGGGGMADFLVAPAEHFYPVPDSVPLDIAAMTEPLAVAWHAVDVSPFRRGYNALIVGGGPIGIAIAHILRIRGAKAVILSEMTPARKLLAQHYGATHVFDPAQEDVADHIRSLTDGVGADVAFDAAGAQGGLNTALSAVRIKGTVVNIALWEKKPFIKANEIMFHELDYTGAALYNEGAFKAVIDALGSGVLQPADMITGKVKLDEVEKGFQTLINDKEEHVKVMVDVQG